MPVGTTISNIFFALQQYGFADFVLPFMLVFGVVFALLEQVGIFGSGGAARKYNAVVAIAIGLLVTIPHVLNPRPDDAISIIQRFLPEFVFLALALLLVIMLLGMVTGVGAGASNIATLLAVIAVIYLVFTIAGAMTGLPQPFDFLQDPNLIALIIVVLIFGIIVWYVTREDGKGPDFWTRLRTLVQPPK